MNLYRILFFAFLALVFVKHPVQAREVKLAVLHGNLDVFDYEISVARMAVENAGHELVLVPITNKNQKRILLELEMGTDDYDLFFSGFSKDRESRLAQVDIPITRGLLGHRVFIVKKSSLDLLDNIRNLKQLKQVLSVGSGVGWPDTEIFIQAGFVVETSVYETLWRMLDRGRYVGFNRGINEAEEEIVQRQKDFPDLVIEPNQMVGYKFDYFFYLNKGDQELASELKLALIKAYETGQFMDNFNTHPMIQKALSGNVKDRNVYYIPNPLISDRIKEIPSKYWHRFLR